MQGPNPDGPVNYTGSYVRSYCIIATSDEQKGNDKLDNAD
jgi:hypothetical protein